jgi:hypothetical protein
MEPSMRTESDRVATEIFVYGRLDIDRRLQSYRKLQFSAKSEKTWQAWRSDFDLRDGGAILFGRRDVAIYPRAQP